MKNLIFLFICSCFFLLDITEVKSQDTLCAQKFLQIKSQNTSSHENLKLHFNALDSLIHKCEYEDLDWINMVLDEAIQQKDSLANHSFPWTYFIFLYRRDSRDEDGFNFLKRIVKYCEKNNHPLNGHFYIELGTKYSNRGDYASEIDAYQKALKAYKVVDSEYEIYALGLLGKFHLNLGNYKEALKFKQQAFNQSQLLESEVIQNYTGSNACLDLGHIYAAIDSLDKAKEYFSLAIEKANKQHNSDLILTCYDESTNFYLGISDLKSAEKNIVDSELLIKNIMGSEKRNFKEIYLAYHKLVRSKFGLATNKALYITEPSDINIESLDIESKKEYYQFAINYSKHKGRLKETLVYTETLNQIITEEAKNQKKSAVDLILEKQNNIQLEKQNSLLIESKRQETFQQYFSMALISFLTLLIWFIFQNLNKTRKHNKAVQAKSEKIKNQFDELERITYVMTHDLKEPINTINSFTNLLVDKHSSSFDSKENNYLNIIKNTSGTMLNSVDVLHNYLLLGLRSNLKTVDLNNLWINAQNNLKASIVKSNAIIDQDDLPTITCFEEDIITLFQSLLSNAIKYAKPTIQPKIYLSYLEMSKFHQFGLADNGIGIEDSAKESIFDLFKRLHFDQKIKGSGIGLANARKIIEQHKGKIWVESTEHLGSTFWFTIAKDQK